MKSASTTESGWVATPGSQRKPAVPAAIRPAKELASERDGEISSAAPRRRRAGIPLPRRDTRKPPRARSVYAADAERQAPSASARRARYRERAAEHQRPA